jgi:hypothetical protein
LLQTVLTVLAVAAGIDHAAGSRNISDFKFGHRITHSTYPTYNLVARYHREDTATPFIPNLVKIRMANATICNVKLNIVRAYFTPVKIPGS